MAFNILVPYDGSRPSDNAIGQTLELAKSFKDNVNVFLLHVIPTISTHPSPEFGMRPIRRKPYGRYLTDIYQEMEKKAKEMLEEKKKIFDKSSIRAETYVSIGDPREDIVTFASAHQISLIIMGTSGLGFFAKLKALGSISRGVSERAKCPVMLVH